MIRPTDLLHPSPTPYFKSFQVFLYMMTAQRKISYVCSHFKPRHQDCYLPNADVMPVAFLMDQNVDNGSCLFCCMFQHAEAKFGTY